MTLPLFAIDAGVGVLGGIAISLAVLGYNLLGDALRDIIDVRID